MNRAEQKEKTRQAIIQAALKLSEEKNFASLSLREVTREVGIAPAAFYRHFKDMDALTLTLVDEVAATLRQLMRQARQRVQTEGASAISVSIDTFMEFLDEKPQLFRILSGERSGGPVLIRESLRKERERFVYELIQDHIKVQQARSIPLDYIPEMSEMMVNQVFTSGVDALDMSQEEREKVAKRLKLQLRMMLVGCRGMSIENNREAG